MSWHVASTDNIIRVPPRYCHISVVGYIVRSRLRLCVGQTFKHPPQTATIYVFVLFLVIRFSLVVETSLFVVVGVANL